MDLSSHEWIPWDLSFGGGLLEALGKQSALETELVGCVDLVSVHGGSTPSEMRLRNCNHSRV